jgi:diguanylate cyclase (GGDEF)-like protein
MIKDGWHLKFPKLLKVYILFCMQAYALNAFALQSVEETPAPAVTATATEKSEPFEELLTELEEKRRLGDVESANKLAGNLFQTATLSQSKDLLGEAFFQKGLNAIEQNQYELGIQMLKEAERQLTVSQNESRLADVYNKIGQALRYQTKYIEAIEMMTKAQLMHKRLGNDSRVHAIYGGLATAHEKVGNLAKAIEYHQIEIEYYRERQDTEAIASALYNIGAIWERFGDLDNAMQHYQEALLLDTQLGDPKHIAYSQLRIGNLYIDFAKFNQARFHIDQALALFSKIEAPRDINWARLVGARLDYTQGDTSKALNIIDQVIAACIEGQYESLLAWAYRFGTEAALKQDELALAARYIQLGIPQAREINEREGLIQFLSLAAQISEIQGKIKEALAYTKEKSELEQLSFSQQIRDSAALAQNSFENYRKQQSVLTLQQEKAVQAAQLAQSQLTKKIMIAAFFVVFMLAAFAYRWHIQRKVRFSLEAQIQERTQQLQQKNIELIDAYKKAEQNSFTDKLTGLNNRWFLERHIEMDLLQSARMHKDLSHPPENADIVVFIIDIDDFKTVNDTYGHQSGDEVLQELSARLKTVFRESDYLIRWGGEEFIGVARFVNHNDASLLAERVLSCVVDSPFRLNTDVQTKLSCSLGFACYPAHIELDVKTTWQTTLSLADACLYAAKYSGKNTWVGVSNIKNLDANKAIYSLEDTKAAMQNQDLTVVSSLPSNSLIRFSENSMS